MTSDRLARFRALSVEERLCVVNALANANRGFDAGGEIAFILAWFRKGKFRSTPRTERMCRVIEGKLSRGCIA